MNVINNRYGIFVCKRSSVELLDKVNYILNNYEAIKKRIIANSLPTKKNFINEFYKILSKKI